MSVNELMKLMSEKYKKMCRALNYFEHFFVFASAVSGCVSISEFDSLVGVPVSVRSNLCMNCRN